jgi:predicted GNAT family N-acyltransferase
MTPQARPARKADVRELAAVMARAFYDDPVMTWVLPDDETRLARLAGLFTAITRHHHLAGGGSEVACDGPAIGAAALWDPPDRWKQTGREQAAMLPQFFHLFGFRSARVRHLQEIMKRQHPEEPHWYLAVIGSDPAVRGKGFGQVLMRSRLDRVDAEHAPAYLESSKHQNIAYYQRFGFEVTGEVVLPEGGPSMWPMWRPPR